MNHGPGIHDTLPKISDAVAVLKWELSNASNAWACVTSKSS